MGFLGFNKKKKKDKQETKEESKDETVGNSRDHHQQGTPSQSQQQATPSQSQQQQQQQNGSLEPRPKPPVRAPQPHSHHIQQQQQQAPPPRPPQQPPQPQSQQPPLKVSVEDIPAGNPEFAKPDVTRDLVKKFISDIWNRGELDLIPHVCSSKIRFNGNTGLDKIGWDGFARMVATIHGALSDYHCEIHSMVVEDNEAFCRLRFSGKHTGDLLGYPPTGRVVSWMGATEFTCLDGRILKVWELGDMKTLEEQLQMGA